MKQFLAIFIARNKEYYRDRAAIGWAFMFPVMVILACALAFSNPDTSVFSIGVYGETSGDSSLEDFLEQPYIKAIPFSDLDRGLERTRHHQLDMMIDAGSVGHYWINTESSSSLAAEALFNANLAGYQANQLQGRKIRYVDWVIPGVLGMNLMFGALFGVGYDLCECAR